MFTRNNVNNYFIELSTWFIIMGKKNVFHLVSHKFGYGLMDGGALVTLAEQWTNVPPQKICRAKEDNKQRWVVSWLLKLLFFVMFFVPNFVLAAIMYDFWISGGLIPPREVYCLCTWTWTGVRTIQPTRLTMLNTYSVEYRWSFSREEIWE